MTSAQRWLLAAAAIVVCCVALIPIGHWEERKHAHSEIAGMRRVLAAIGPIDQPSLDAYRKSVGPGYDCLLYKRGSNPFALEICFDAHARVVEAYDRRGASPKIWSLREDATASPLRIDRNRAERLITRLAQPA